MNLTVRQIIIQLQSKGHNVQFRNRTDGGVIITKIDGKSYTGATGNAAARGLVGATISSSRQYQLNKIKPPKTIAPKARKAHPIVDIDVNSLMKKAQRAWRYYKVDAANGRITKKQVLWKLQNEGKQATMEALNKAIAYAKGYAYPENVDWLVKVISQYETKVDREYVDDLEKVATYLDQNKYTIKDKDLVRCYQELYDLNKPTANTREIIRRIKAIFDIQ